MATFKLNKHENSMSAGLATIFKIATSRYATLGNNELKTSCEPQKCQKFHPSEIKWIFATILSGNCRSIGNDV